MLVNFVLRENGLPTLAVNDRTAEVGAQATMAADSTRTCSLNCSRKTHCLNHSNDDSTAWYGGTAWSRVPIICTIVAYSLYPMHTVVMSNRE